MDRPVGVLCKTNVLINDKIKIIINYGPTVKHVYVKNAKYSHVSCKGEQPRKKSQWEFLVKHLSECANIIDQYQPG